jgi:predicted GIY-YIG superfamily endonuclease
MSDVHATSVVNPRPVEHLYRLRGTSGGLLYVGITNNWPSRMKQHMADKPWWYEVAGVELVGVIGTRAQLEAIERAVIKIEEPMYNVVHNRKTTTIDRPMPVEVAPEVAASFSVGDRVVLTHGFIGGMPGVGTIVSPSAGGQCWMVEFDSNPGEPWTLTKSEITSAKDRRFHDYGLDSSTPDERQAIIEQYGEDGAEWHFYATRPMQVGWVVEHPQFGEGVVVDFQPMALDSTVTIRFFDELYGVIELCSEWASLKVVAK